MRKDKKTKITGYECYRFNDNFGYEFFIDKFPSDGNAFFDCINLGRDKEGVHIIAKNKPLVPYKLPGDVRVDSTISLNRDQAKQLLHILHLFVETGEIIEADKKPIPFKNLTELADKLKISRPTLDRRIKNIPEHDRQTITDYKHSPKTRYISYEIFEKMSKK